MQEALQFFLNIQEFGVTVRYFPKNANPDAKGRMVLGLFNDGQSMHALGEAMFDANVPTFVTFKRVSFAFKSGDFLAFKTKRYGIQDVRVDASGLVHLSLLEAFPS